jgi:hypothetical protein
MHRPLLLIKGVHRNERSAFELADIVFERLKSRGVPVELEEIPYERTMWPVFDNYANDPNIDERLMQTIGGADPRDEFDIPRDKDYLPFSFHNYPVVEKESWYGLKKNVIAAALDPSRVGNFELAKWGEMSGTGEVSAMSPFCLGYVLEIPAVYNIETPVKRIPQIDSCYAARYLFDVDLEKTRTQGFMDERIIAAITNGILGLGGYRHLRNQSELS